MAVNRFVSTAEGLAAMAGDVTQTISVRVSREVAVWVAENGGSALIKSLLYAHIMVATQNDITPSKRRLLQNLIDGSVAISLLGAKETDEDTQPSFKLE